MLTRLKNPHTGQKEYCLVSSDGRKVLEWYGPARPSPARVQKSEARVEMFKHMKGKGK